MRPRIHHWCIRDSDKGVHAHLPVRINHFFGWWSHHQCFNMFRIRSMVEDATPASSLAGTVITRGRKASRETWLKGVVGRRSRKAWSEDVADRRGRKTWPEGVAGRRGRKAWSKLALGFEPIRLSRQGDSEIKPYARLRMKLWSHNAGRPCAGVPNNSASVEAGRPCTVVPNEISAPVDM